MDTNGKTLLELIEFHREQAKKCYGMSPAAFGCGDLLGGKSYAESADFHQKRVEQLTTQVQVKVLEDCVRVG
jgi:hypothetical protein